MRQNLVHLLDGPAMQSIDEEIGRNVRQLFALGEDHYDFGKRSAKNWRQAVSRTYYGAYAVWRAIRLYVQGSYSTDPGEHKKIDQLPDDFPNKSTYSNQLKVLREDRNVCDYDHAADEGDLVLGTKESLDLVLRFTDDARSYLERKGSL